MRKAALLAALLAAPLVAPRVAAGAAAASDAGDAGLGIAFHEEALVGITLDQELLADALIARIDERGSLYLPLGQLASLLSLAIDVDPSGRLASGHVIDAARAFELDAGAGRVTIGGASAAVDARDVLALPEDLFIRTRLLEQWLPIRLRFDASAALVRVTATEPLPMQVRRQRERMAGGLSRFQESLPEGPRMDLAWSAFDGPFVDQVLRLEARSGSGFSMSHSTHATAEILGLQAETFLSGNDRDLLSDSRFTLGRRDPDAGILGPLGLREALAGDVFDGGLPLIMRPQSGRGFRMGTFPLQQPDVPGAESLRGPLPAGWMVELHRDGAIIDAQVAGPDEIYEFLDVPLRLGSNELRLVFRGPRGEEREVLVRRQVGPRSAEAGSFHWRASAFEGDDGRQRMLASIERAFGERFVATTSFASIEMPGGHERYVAAGLQASLGSVLATFDVAASFSGGMVAEARTMTRLGPVDVTLRHAELSSFDSERFNEGRGRVRRSSGATFHAALRKAGLRMPVSLSIERDELESGDDELAAILRAGLGAGRISATSELSFRQSPEELGGDRIEGRLLVRARAGEHFLRGDLSYLLDDGFELESAMLGLESMLGDRWFLRAEAGHDWLQDATRASIGAEWTGRHFGLGGEISWDDDGPRVALLIRTGVARRPGIGWHARAEPLAGLGAAEIIAFIDADGDGTKDEGEMPLQARVRAARTGVSEQTDEEGRAFLAALPPHREIAVSLDAEDLEDPLAVPTPEAVRFVPRPGRVARIELPVVLCGDVAGTVYLRDEAGERPIGGAIVEVVDDGGNVVASSPSAHDGFFNVTRIPPGRHAMRARLASGAGASRFAISAASRIDVPATGLVADGLSLVLQPPADPALRMALLEAELGARLDEASSGARRSFPSLAPVSLLEGAVALTRAALRIRNETIDGRRPQVVRASADSPGVAAEAAGSN